MLISRAVERTISISLMALGTGLVTAQDYPTKTIRIITGEAAGGTDFASRLIAKGISEPLGQQVIVENRGGGGLVVGPILAKAPPDGHTLLLYGSTIWVAPLLRTNAPYDPLTDFAPITLVVSSPAILAVHPSMPVKSVKDLIALAKAKPGELNYSATGIGSANHLSAELFNAMAGVSIVLINYKGTAPTLTALLSGEVQLTFANASGVVSHVKAGRLRALAVTSAKPTLLAPGLPTVASSGLPGYESASFNALFAPAKTPKTTIDRLNHEIVRLLTRTDVKESFFNNGVEVVASSAEQLTGTIKAEMARLRKVITATGIRER